MKPIKVYLAIPYSFNPELSYKIANKVAAGLMAEGYVVFSPISHSHPIAAHLAPELRTDHEFWMKQDLPMLEWADELHVIELGGKLTEQSRGVNEEMHTAFKLGKPIKYIFYGQEAIL